MMAPKISNIEGPVPLHLFVAKWSSDKIVKIIRKYQKEVSIFELEE